MSVSAHIVFGSAEIKRTQKGVNIPSLGITCAKQHRERMDEDGDGLCHAPGMSERFCLTQAIRGAIYLPLSLVPSLEGLFGSITLVWISSMRARKDAASESTGPEPRGVYFCPLNCSAGDGAGQTGCSHCGQRSAVCMAQRGQRVQSTWQRQCDGTGTLHSSWVKAAVTQTAFYSCYIGPLKPGDASR